jgi:hypothetical protein
LDASGDFVYVFGKLDGAQVVRRYDPACVPGAGHRSAVCLVCAPVSEQIQSGAACSSSLRVARSARQMAPDIPQLSLLKAQAARALSLCDSAAAALTLCRDTV